MPANALAAAAARRRVDACTVTRTSGLPVVRTTVLPAPVEMDCVETCPRRSAARMPALAAASSIDDSARAIVPAVEGFACGPCRKTPPTGLYDAPRYTVALAFQTSLPPSEIR